MEDEQNNNSIEMNKENESGLERIESHNKKEKYSITSKDNLNKKKNNPSQNFPKTNQIRKNLLPPITNSRYSTRTNFYNSSNNNFNITNSSFKTFSTTFNNNLTEEEINNNTKKFLKQELLFSKKEMNQTTKDLHEIKIKFGKLLEENKYNKNIIEKVLLIDPNKNYTKADVKDKIENCILSEEEKEIIKEAYEMICLKEEIEKIKDDCIEKENKLNYYNKNVKYTNNILMEDDFFNKEEEKRKLMRYIKRLEKHNEENKKINNDLKIKADYFQSNSKEINDKLKEIEKEENDLQNNYNQLCLEEQNNEKDIRKKNEILKNKRKKKEELEKEIEIKEKQIEDMEEFNKNEKELNQDLDRETEKVKILENEYEEKKKEKEDFDKENKDLFEKISKNTKEENYLKKKAKIPKGQIETIKNLEEEINKLKELNENEDKKNEEEMKKLQEK